ncbi:uncharacterized protein TNCV_699051 [Trichonephila clavipes]|nr:uncharacterized protein TNCV_699051 [Trichonephila clavipes]
MNHNQVTRKTPELPQPTNFHTYTNWRRFKQTCDSGSRVVKTLKTVLVSGDKKKSVRFLLDSVSHRSYILKNVAREMGYPSLRQEKLVHSLFGGISSKQITHDCYKIWLRDLDEKFACNFDALDQDKICEDVQPVCNESWIRELKDNIILPDINDGSESIDILIGAEIMGKMLTEKEC